MVATQLRTRGIVDERVLGAMATVPRELFVDERQRDYAYADEALPIESGQTISQPYVVALMTELAAVRPGDKVLEIGTGSGYQAAVLAEMTERVDTVEIIPELAHSAAERLRRLGYGRVAVKNDDGYPGWAAHAPYDAIVVTAAPDHVPPPLVRQLKEGGRLVIPVGPPGSYQTLWRIVKLNGEPHARNVTGVIFVPLVRGRR
jgi:protein-L-isoaspartate(D-aspartate) O-methyltransferase